MSHTIGQVKEDNQQSTSNSSQAGEDLSTPVDKSSESVSLLSDADYEFLFNQLLEGIAHGWHDRRIAKFFHQLGERGKSPDWIAWLERLRAKVITSPVQSKRQLGTLMIRFGELTQSTPEVKEIGLVSNRVGRELLFGNTEDLIWEYAGPDLIIDSSPVATKEDISARLPANFSELGSAAIANKESQSQETTQEDSAELLSKGKKELSEEESTVAEANLEQSVSLAEEIDRESAATENSSGLSADSEQLVTPIDDLMSDPFFETLLPEKSPPSLEDLTTSVHENNENEEVSNGDQVIDAEKSPNTQFQDLNADIQEFEFELDDAAPPSESKASLTSSSSEALSSLLESDTSLEATSTDRVDDPVAIDVQQVMNLIQQDSELAQEISAKLNISPSATEPVDSLAANPPLNNEIPAIAPDDPSIELIEGWFNLGLKQVSAGEFNKAIASWEKALKINPNLSEAWHNRGSALGRLGEYDRAVESFEKALAIDSQNYQAWNDRAHALYQMQQWSAAAKSWSNAVKLAPGNHLFWYNRGCALEQLESWAEAIDSYEKSLEIKPDFEPARSRYTNLVADSSHAN